MGATSKDDHFYVIQTRVVCRALEIYRKEYLGQSKRVGGTRKDTRHWALHLFGSEQRTNRGFAKKWSKYCDNWDALEGSLKLSSAKKMVIK